MVFVELNSFLLGVFVCWTISYSLKLIEQQRRSASYQKGAESRMNTLAKKKGDERLIYYINNIINVESLECDFTTKFKLIVCEFARYYTVNMNIFETDEWLQLVTSEKKNARSKSLAKAKRSKSPKRKENAPERVPEPSRAITPEPLAITPEPRADNTKWNPPQLSFSVEALTAQKKNMKKVNQEQKKVEKGFNNSMINDIRKTQQRMFPKMEDNDN